MLRIEIKSTAIFISRNGQVTYYPLKVITFPKQRDHDKICKEITDTLKNQLEISLQ